MFVIPIFAGLALFIAAFSLWTRAKNQPEDIPMYSISGRPVTKRDVYVGAVLCLILGTVFVIIGLTL